MTVSEFLRNAVRKSVHPLLVALLIAGCGSLELTKEQAAQAIEGSEQAGELASQIPFLSGGMDKAMRQGVVDVRAQLSLQAQQVFERVGSIHAENLGPFVSAQVRSGQPFSPSHVAALRPDKRPTITVSVTGIAETDDPNLRHVQFRWRYDGLSELAKRYLTGGGRGSGKLRHYDTGWRVESLEVGFLDESGQTEDEKAAEAEEERQRIAAINEERARLEALRSEAKQQTNRLLTFRAYRGKDFRLGYPVNVEIWNSCLRADASFVRFSSKQPVASRRAERPGQGQTNIWFGDIADATRSRDVILVKWWSISPVAQQTRLYFEDVSQADRAYQSLYVALMQWRRKYSAVLAAQ